MRTSHEYVSMHMWWIVGPRYLFWFVLIGVVDGLGSNLIEMIMNALLKSGGLIEEEMSMKLLCLGLMGWMYFRGAK
jgi:hypothetical protein